MPVSYLISNLELTVLAYFSGCSELIGFSSLPVVEKQACQSILSDLDEKGMLHLSDDSVAVHPPISFILSAIEQPLVAVKAENGALACCTKNLGVVVSRVHRAKNRYRITPLPNPEETASKFWQVSGACFETMDFSLYRRENGWEKTTLTQTETEELFSQAYKEVEV